HRLFCNWTKAISRPRPQKLPCLRKLVGETIPPAREREGNRTNLTGLFLARRISRRAYHVQMNMKSLRRLLRRRSRRDRARQLELNLWPKHQKLFARSWRPYVMKRSTR